ncbi:MAG: fumarylacetoacetate hydrolase family protein [Acidimicrobiales bacterium]|jgi:2-keto-4-pentenoate hydratase/2-oxohepta-3-ene-1,7-dioic acid hydratase in catechol pathway
MTRLANLAGRAVLVTREGGIDIEKASDGIFAADTQALYERWEEFRLWEARFEPDDSLERLEIRDADLLSPAPWPAQVFGIGLNYRDHCAETGMQLPTRVATFTKFPTCLTGGFHEVELPEGSVDYEVELVVVMGARARRVADWEAWSLVAGVTVGQDLSERILQREAGGQFCLGKSFPGFGPMGPWLVTPDELTEPDDLALSCSLNGEVMQDGRTSDMVFSVPRLIEELSAVVTLLPGDVIFTGTPAGVGWVRQPPRFLQPGDVLESTIEGIGTISNRMIVGS